MKKELPEITDFIQCHKYVEAFDYSMAVDWAIELIQKGTESNNILMLASFSKPIDSLEISSYVSAVLDELNLEERVNDSAELSHVHFLMKSLSKGKNLRENLSKIAELFWVYDEFKLGLPVFYNLHYAWSDLDYDDFNHYLEGVDKSNIEEITIREANLWIDEYIHGETVKRNDYSIPQVQQPETILEKDKTTYIKSKRTLLEWIKFHFLPKIEK